MSARAATGEAAPAESSITLVYNHEGPTMDGSQLRRGGFSAEVQLGDTSALFDLGGEAGAILDNLLRVGVVTADLDAVLISHNHWDHVYGLPGVMSGSRTRRRFEHTLNPDSRLEKALASGE